MRSEEEIKERLSRLMAANSDANSLAMHYRVLENLPDSNEMDHFAKKLLRDSNILRWVLGDRDDWP